MRRTYTFKTCELGWRNLSADKAKSKSKFEPRRLASVTLTNDLAKSIGYEDDRDFSYDAIANDNDFDPVIWQRQVAAGKVPMRAVDHMIADFVDAGVRDVGWKRKVKDGCLLSEGFLMVQAYYFERNGVINGPRIMAIVNEGTENEVKTPLDEDTIGTIDHMMLDSCRITINLSPIRGKDNEYRAYIASLVVYPIPGEGMDELDVYFN